MGRLELLAESRHVPVGAVKSALKIWRAKTAGEVEQLIAAPNYPVTRCMVTAFLLTSSIILLLEAMDLVAYGHTEEIDYWTHFGLDAAYIVAAFNFAVFAHGGSDKDKRPKLHRYLALATFVIFPLFVFMIVSSALLSTLRPDSANEATVRQFAEDENNLLRLVLGVSFILCWRRMRRLVKIAFEIETKAGYGVMCYVSTVVTIAITILSPLIVRGLLSLTR